MSNEQMIQGHLLHAFPGGRRQIPVEDSNGPQSHENPVKHAYEQHSLHGGPIGWILFRYAHIPRLQVVNTCHNMKGCSQLLPTWPAWHIRKGQDKNKHPCQLQWAPLALPALGSQLKIKSMKKRAHTHSHLRLALDFPDRECSRLTWEKGDSEMVSLIGHIKKHHKEGGLRGLTRTSSVDLHNNHPQTRVTCSLTCTSGMDQCDRRPHERERA